MPSFYADFQDRNGRHCAEDVEAELAKLKEVGVDGIILDLRNNGGGSLRDVVKMSGFFIEDGPIVQVKSREYEPEVLSDVNPAVQYDGPLVVMVNNFSASASEILAAALQDYGRAVIVGSNSTFGKGTVQRFIDLDRTLRGFDDVKPLGQVKLTTQKFYRINGGSTQLRGVTPDIVLPDAYSYIETSEKEEEFPMPWTEIAAVDYSQEVLQLAHLDKIRTRSNARVAANEVFGMVQENARRMKELRDVSSYPLSLETFQTSEAARKAAAEKYEGLFDEIVNKNVKNLDVDLPAFENDESKQARNKDFLESVSKDLYIHEVLSIMHDIIELERVAVRD
ncbi:MAG: carboxy terminal-processing peptidase [Saprospiraceae bacterium]